MGARTSLIGLMLLAAMPLMGAAPNKTASDVSSIAIDIEWNGIPPEHSAYREIIQNNDGVFTRADGSPVPRTGVDALLTAARRAPRTRAIAADFGLSKEWLSANTGSAFKEFLHSDDGHGEGFYTQPQRALFMQSFSNPALVGVALTKYYNQPLWLDDDVQIDVSIDLQNGRAVKLQTVQQRPLMLPWAVSRQGLKYKTFDPRISEAFQALVPERVLESVLRGDRLRRGTFISELPAIVGAEIASQWDRLPKYNLDAAVAPLEQKYHVQISHDGSEMTSPTALAWNADLSWADFPTQVNATVTLPIVNNTIENQAAIPAARRFAYVVSALPWIREVLKRPQTTLTVLIENGKGTGISPSERATMLGDLRRIGRGEVANSIAPRLDGAFVVMFKESRVFSQWVILPDGRSVLWNYYDANPTPSILGLSAAKLDGKRCSDGMLCSGLVRLPDGTIQ